MTVVRVAVIGAGVSGNLHAAAWASLPDVTITSVVDIDEAAGKRLANSYKAHFTLSLEQATEGADILSICTPTGSHTEPAVCALEAGVDTLIEMPAAVTSEDRERMLDVSRRSGALVTVAAVGRFYPEVAIAKRWLEEGRIGEPGWFSEVCRLDPSWLSGWYFTPPWVGGGILNSAMANGIDRLFWLVPRADADVINVVADPHADASSMEQRAEAYLDLGLRLTRLGLGRPLARLDYEWTREEPERREIEIVGSEGIMRIRPSHGIRLLTRGGVEYQNPYPRGLTYAAKALIGLREVMVRFLAARSGQMDGTPDLFDDARAMRVVDAVRDAARNLSGLQGTNGRAIRPAGGANHG